MPIRFQVDPDFYDHPKAIGMDDSAVALWVRAGSYSAAKLTDGFVADAALSLLTTVPDHAASELVARGLWRRVRGGYLFHEWEQRNLTRARVDQDRRVDRRRKQRRREMAKAEAKQQVSDDVVRSDVRPDGRMESERNPAVSVSVSESVSVSGSGHGPSRDPPPGPHTPGPEPPQRCNDHVNDPWPPPCGACADARHQHERWQRDHDRWQASRPQPGLSGAPDYDAITKAAANGTRREQLAAAARAAAAGRRPTPLVAPSVVPPPTSAAHTGRKPRRRKEQR